MQHFNLLDALHYVFGGAANIILMDEVFSEPELPFAKGDRVVFKAGGGKVFTVSDCKVRPFDGALMASVQDPELPFPSEYVPTSLLKFAPKEEPLVMMEHFPIALDEPRFIVVVREDNGNWVPTFAPADNPKVHLLQEDAEAEARRLARKVPGKAFYVLTTTYGAMMGKLPA